MTKRILYFILPFLSLFIFCLEVVTPVDTAAVTVTKPVIEADTVKQSTTPILDSSLILSVTVSDSDANIQWLKNGVVIVNEIDDSLIFDSLTIADTGSYIVIVSNTAGSDTSEVFTITFTVKPINNIPGFIDSLTITNYSVIAGDTIELVFKAVDADSLDTLTYFIVDTTAMFTDSLLTLVTTNNDIGTHQIVITATDGKDTAKVTVDIVVTAKNNIPIFVDSLTTTSYAVIAGDTINLTFKAVDADSLDTVTYFIIDTNLLFSDSSFSVVTTASDTGAYQITIVASDGKDTTKISADIVISKGNSTPVISVDSLNNNDTIAVTELDTISITFNTTDADSTDTIIFNIPDSLPVSSQFDTATNIFTFIPTLLETGYGISKVYRNLRFIASDKFSSDTFTVSLIISDKDVAPIATNTTASVTEDSSVTFSVSSNLSDASIDSIKVDTVLNGKLGTATISEANITYTPIANQNGIDTLTYIVSDILGLKDSAQIIITISPKNDVPIILTPIEDKSTRTISEGGEQNISFITDDIDGTKPTKLKITPTNSWITVTPVASTPGSFTVTLKPGYDIVDANTGQITSDYTVKAIDAQDSTIFATHTLNITVTDKNLTPKFTAFPEDDTIPLHSSKDYIFGATDIDGDDLTISFTNLKPNMSFDSASGVLTVFADRANYDINYNYSVKAVVSDGILSDTANWTIRTKAHVWEKVTMPSAINLFNAVDENTSYALSGPTGSNPYGAMLGKYDGGVLNTVGQVSFGGSPYTSYPEVKLFGNKIIVEIQFIYKSSYHKINIFTLKGDSIILDTSFTSYGTSDISYTYLNKTGMTIYASHDTIVHFTGSSTNKKYGLTGFTKPCDLEASDTGTFAILLNETGGVFSNKTGNYYQWNKVNDGAFSQVEIASTNGNVAYFFDDDSLGLYNTINGTASAITINSIDNSKLSNKLIGMNFCSDSVGWVVDELGDVYFSNSMFSSTKTGKESNLSDIKQIIVAEDRKAVYAVDNTGNVYKY